MQTNQKTSMSQRRTDRSSFLRGMPNLGYRGSSLTIRKDLTYEDSYKIRKRMEGR